MQINVARCDYLTLTTYDKSAELMSCFADLYPKIFGKEIKTGGYQGHQWDGLFFGVGKQRRKAHFMMRASGEGSETILWRTAELDVRCTRIDLQITIWLPPKYEARKLYDILESIDTVWPGRKLVPELRQSGDGLDTVYIGSRTSDRFARVYIKPDHKGNPCYLRFEMEFKGSMAVAVRDALVEKRASTKNILRSELNRLPFTASRSLRAFSDVLGDVGTRIRPETVYSENSTLDWIERQVEPSVLRLLHSHEHGDRMRKILYRWVGNLPDRE